MSEQGRTLRTVRAGQPVSVGEPIAMDSQSVIYSASAGGASFTVTWYPASPDTAGLADSVAARIDAGRPDPAFVWPIDTAASEEVPGFGYVTPVPRPGLEPLADVLSRADSLSFPVLISVGRQLVRAFAALHRSGWCYRDFSLRNVLVDAYKAEIALTGFEDIGPDGSAGYVGRVTAFMAPEIARGEAGACAGTDLHVLAVLLFVLLMHGNPLEGAAVKDGELLLAPVFVFDPEDDSNRPVPGDPVLTWWPVYPRFLRDLFEQAFTTGLSDPQSGRVTEGQWRAALARLDECVSSCTCGAAVLADHDDAGQRCWHCDRVLD
jgi:eukaryotic-like serine/threonine-protein kinase